MKKGSFDLTGKAVFCGDLPALGDAGKEIFRALKVACNGLDDPDFGDFLDIANSKYLKKYISDGDYILTSELGVDRLLQPSDVLGQAAINAAMDGATIVFEGDVIPNGEKLLYWVDGSKSIHAQPKDCELVAYKLLEEKPRHRIQPSIESRILSEKTGSKHDQGKPLYNLIPVHAESELVDVLTFGATKYAPNQWRNVPNAKERYTAAAMRHLAAYRMGESHDTESGKHHLAHAMCCLSFIIELDLEDNQ